MSASPPDIDDRADRIHDRWQAFMLYVDDAFRIAVVALGYKGGRAEAAITRDDVTFEAQRFDDQVFAMDVARHVIDRIQDRYAVAPMTGAQIDAEIADAIADRGRVFEHVPRWIGEKNAAVEVATFVAAHLPRVERVAPPSARGGIPSFSDFMRASVRKATP